MKNISIKINLPATVVHSLFDYAYEHGATIEGLIEALVISSVDESYSMEEDTETFKRAFSELDKKGDKRSFSQWLLSVGYLDDAIDYIEDIRSANGHLMFYELFPEKDRDGSEVKALKELCTTAKESLEKLHGEYKATCDNPIESYSEGVHSLFHYVNERSKALNI